MGCCGYRLSRVVVCVVVYESVRRAPVDCCVASAPEGDLQYCVVDDAHVSAPLK